MNTDRATVERVAESLDWLDLSIFAADTVRHATALLRALLDERDEARELAKRWRDAYEWDALDPTPEYNFPWEEKP